MTGKEQLFDEHVDRTTLDVTRLTRDDLFGLVGLQAPSGTRASGLAFEDEMASLLTRLGYNAALTPHGPDGGVDIVAEKSDVGGCIRLWVQCKNTTQPVAVDIVRSLNGVLPAGDRGVTGVVACRAGFTREACTFAKSCHIQLWDAVKLDSLTTVGGHMGPDTDIQCAEEQK